jgi:RNA polymerase sigma-70 factor, ECF subfamily
MTASAAIARLPGLPTAAGQFSVPMSANPASERLAGARRGPGPPGKRREGALVRDAQRGSSEALEELFRRHWRRAHRAAFLVIGDAAAAEDIAQESFLAAIRAIDRFDRRRPFGPWLHRITVNRAIDFSRARSLRAESVLSAAAEGPGRSPRSSGWRAGP